MKKSNLHSLCASAFVAGLLLSPLAIKAEAFGYAGIKAGYSHLFQANATYYRDQEISSFPSSNASSFAFGASAGFGYLFTPDIGMRLEGEYLFRSSSEYKRRSVGKSAFSLETQIQNILGNVYLDYYVIPSVNLYLSTGMGVNFRDSALHWVDSNKSEIKYVAGKQDKIGFAWQIGLGVGYAITQNLGFDFNIRYVGFGKMSLEQMKDFDGKIVFPLSSLDTLLGFNYRF